MNLQKKNKYSKKIALGLGSILIGGMLASCSNVEANEVETTPIITNTPSITSTPEPTRTPFITSTPEPTRTPSPTKIPIVEITGEELEREIEKLEIVNNSNKKIESSEFLSVLFKTKYGETKFAFIKVFLENNKKIVVIDAFTEELLFCYDKPFDSLLDSILIKNFKDIYDENPYFTDATITEINTLICVFNNYDDLGISTSDETVELYGKYMRADIINSKDWKLTKKELAAVYINVVPKEYRITAFDLYKEYEKDDVKVKKLG